MNMVSFTAEASLYRTGEHYQHQPLATITRNAAGVVRPATVYVANGKTLFCCEPCKSLPGGYTGYCCDPCGSIPGSSPVGDVTPVVVTG